MKPPKISTRQHLVPGLLDFSEEELSPARTGIDLWTVLAALIVAVGMGLVVWTTSA
jgi:hypothetical protein